MDYYHKYLKYKTKYLNLLSQKGGTLDQNILFFENYQEQNLSNPRILNIIEDKLQNPTDLGDCPSIQKLQYIFPLVCKGPVSYDKSTSPKILDEYNDKIVEYLGIDKLLADYDFVQNFEVLEEMGLFPGTDSPFVLELESTMSDDSKLNPILKNIINFLDVETQEIKTERIHYNIINSIFGASGEQHKILTQTTSDLSNGAMYNGQPIKIWQIGNDIYIQKDTDYYKLITDGNKGTTVNIRTINIPEKDPVSKSKIQNVYNLDLECVKLDSAPPSLPAKYSFFALDISKSGTYILETNTITRVFVYERYKFNADTFKLLKDKIDGGTSLTGEEKDKIKIAVGKYLALTHDYGISEFPGTIWDSAIKQDICAGQLQNIIESLLEDFTFNIGTTPFFDEKTRKTYTKKIIEHEKRNLINFNKHWFMQNSYRALRLLLKQTTSDYSQNSFSQSTLTPVDDMSYHLGIILLMNDLTFAGAIAHELGHNIYQNVELNTIFKNLLTKYYKDNEQYFASNSKTYNEFIADLFSVLCLDKYLELYAGAKDNNAKMDIIRNWFLFNCTIDASTSSISGHPHNSFRVNTLLISKRVYKIVCQYIKDGGN